LFYSGFYQKSCSHIKFRNFLNKHINEEQKNNFLLKGITQNILLLGFVSLFTDLSSQMVFPLIPLFLTSVMGTSASVVGIVEGSAQATASLFKVISGFWSDKIKKRKPFVLFGYSLSTLMKPLFAFASTWLFVLFIRIFERIGKGVRDAPRDAIIAESCKRSVRGKAYGFHRAMDGVGSVLGAILALILLPLLGYKNLFLFAFIPSILAVLTIFFIKEKNKSLKKKIKKETQRTSFKELSLNLKLFILASSVFALGHFGYPFLLLKAKNLGLTDHSSILLYVFFYIIYVLFSIPSGMLSDKFGRKPILIMSYTLFGFISFGLIFVSSIKSLMLFFILYGVFYAMIDGAQRAFVADLAPKHLKATALGTFYTLIGIVALPGGFIAGFLWDKINPTATFIYAITLTLISLFLLSFIVKDGFSKKRGYLSKN